MVERNELMERTIDEVAYQGGGEYISSYRMAFMLGDEGVTTLYGERADSY